MEISKWILIIGNFAFTFCLIMFLFLRLESKIVTLRSVMTQLIDVINDGKNSSK